MYIVGVDGGGTKTKVAVFTKQQVLIGVKEVIKPSSIDTVSIKESIQTIVSIIKDIIPIEEFFVRSIFLGLGGISNSNDSNSIFQELLQYPYFSDKTMIDSKNDIYNAHAGGLDGKSGIAVIIGTGSVAFGKDEKGNTHRVGGYSYLEGDPGSSYDLGRQVLKLIAKQLDGRISTSLLLETSKESLHITCYEDFVGVINSIDRTTTASLAKLVTKYANEEDPYSIFIIEQATDEIVLMIQAIEKKLTIKNKEICIIGSLGNADTLYKDMLYKKLLSFNKRYDIHKSIDDPVIGSIILAQELLNN
jgi:N-acetylglucosamine kinase-like BadF-type ATPase